MCILGLEIRKYDDDRYGDRVAGMSKVEAVNFPSLHDRIRPQAELASFEKQTVRNVEPRGAATQAQRLA